MKKIPSFCFTYTFSDGYTCGSYGLSEKAIIQIVAVHGRLVKVIKEEM